MKGRNERTTLRILTKRFFAFTWSGLMMTAAFAGVPLWTFEPLTATSIEVPANSTAIVQYQVTNQSNRTHTLVLQPIQSVTQIRGPGLCSNPFVLRGKDSCTLSIQINGSQLNRPIAYGPVVCQEGSTLQCYQPGANNILRITQGSEIIEAVITVSGSPLMLTANGPSGQLTINNISTQVVATNITSDFTGTALDGNVTEIGNTCAVVAPGASCTLTFTPGNTVVSQTDFTIQGANTNALTAAIAIQSGSTLSSVNPSSGPAAGGTGVTLTGTGLTGATGVTFGGVAATSVNVINSTTVTAVTPAHAAGLVDVVIDTPAGGATLTNGYVYLVTAVGQSSGGGLIACLNGGLNNLITVAADNGIVEWGGLGVAIGATAQSITDGASNTAAIVNALGNNGGVPYGAKVCNDFEVDSQGNTPCQVGNTCYNDWFLPADNNLTPSGQLNCLYTNRAIIGGFANNGYWSSTEDVTDPTNRGRGQDFGVGNQIFINKAVNFRIRCVRAFTP